ncbi:AMP-binding protein [Micromonospora sp. DT178]|uniref:AMP-binding protein n=1 Tax=Micromonospora sp. DT178 TaxID=3393436 RepID=UPI003CEF56A4
MKNPRLIHEAVVGQARIRPQALAIVHRRERVDYATLDAAAESYASLLRDAGVRSRDTVPVLLPRTPRLAAVLLAVLKCGAAYAALDRRWPLERIRRICSMLGAPVAVVAEGEAIPGISCWTVEDEPLRRVASRAGDRRPVLLDDADAATVFFTSGSTGTPKGVLSPHRATTRLFQGAGFADFGPGRVVLQAAPVSWDAFSMELWGPLTSGGTSVIADTDYLLPTDLARLTADYGVDTAWLTSSLFNFLIDEDDVDRQPCFRGLRQVLTGGERLSTTHVARFLERYPEISLTNGYGPAEACVFATTHRIVRSDCDRPDGIPLGRPVSETSVHVLGGEICVGGSGLAIRYLGDAGASAAAFVTVPIDGTSERIYRTGDMGFLDQDGLLHYRGRADLQVKIAGHRVEPGEIESVARQIPGIENAAVVPVPAPGGGYDRLALFYVASAPIESAALRGALATQLPGYLVPHMVLQRAVLPVTTNGKLDRQSLLASL